MYILIIVYPCGIVLNAFAERGISEDWTSQWDMWLWVSRLRDHQTDFIYIFYVALACGQHNARSDWLRATSEQGIRQR